MFFYSKTATFNGFLGTSISYENTLTSGLPYDTEAWQAGFIYYETLSAAERVSCNGDIRKIHEK